MLPPVRKGAIKRCFCQSVRVSISPSVVYIANNSRTQRPSVPKFGRKVPHLRCNSHTSFKVKRSKDRVTRPINADTHRVPYLSNGKAYELQTLYTNGGRRPELAAGAMTSKVKGHVITLSRVGPMAHKSKTNSRSITKTSSKEPMSMTDNRGDLQGQRSMS